MRLWHMHSKVLKGFYASEVYVVAPNLEIATLKAVCVFDLWIKNEVKEYGYNPLTSAFPDDEDYSAELADVYVAFQKEAETQLAIVPYNSVIFRRT